jgi:hypothetical protein
MNRHPRIDIETASSAGCWNASPFTYQLRLPHWIASWVARAKSHPLPIAFLFLLLGCLRMSAYENMGNNLLKTDGSAEDTQKAIDAATNGTIIQLPEGKYRWRSPITNSNHVAIHLVAQNIGGTIIKRAYKGGDMLLLNASPNGNVEVSGIHFEDPYADSEVNWSFCLDINQLTGRPVLIHDCSFVSSRKNGYNYLVRFAGNGGVVWNCSFASRNDMLGGISFVDTSSTCAPWNQADSMGAGPDSTGLNKGDPTGSLDTYIEDCLFQDMDLACTNFDDNSRAVVRFSTLNNATLNTHGQDTSIWGCRHWEIYNNTFNYSTSGKSYGGETYPLNMDTWFMVRGGTGVITNNAMDNIPYNKLGVFLTVFSITRLDSIPCQTGYPAAHQTGQGWSAVSTAAYGHPVVARDGTGAVPDPIFVWNNTGTETEDPGYVGIYPFLPDECGNHQQISTYLQKGRDYFVNEARPGWAPYTYPHPLRANALGATGPGPLELYPPAR